MKSTFITIIFLSFSVACLAQSTVIEKVWTTSSSKNGLQEVDTRIDKLITRLNEQHFRSDIHRLYRLFQKTHKRFLHSYTEYPGIEDLAKGRYDCLTATSLFADVLKRAGYNYNIIETNYHIFIIVNTKDGDVILETTDRLGGFINDQKKISKAIAKYQQNALATSGPSHYEYTFNLYQTVDPDQLEGLLYYNQAVKAFNKQQWTECSEKLSAASLTTNSPRVAELGALLSVHRGSLK